MKRTKLFSVALLAAAWLTGGSAQAWDEPSQGADGVYQIGTASELEWFAEQVNSGTTTINALLTADITCNAETSYGTIGNSSKPYKGTFDGGGHRIINRNVNTGTSNGAGFFGYLNGGALIKNLILDSSCSFTGNHVVGAFAGAMTGGGTVVFENCVNEAPVTATASNGASAAFVGASQGTTAAAIKVTNSANTGTITCGESGRATVFCSYSNSGSTFINCYNTGMLSKLNAGNQNFVQWSNSTPVITNCYELSGVANATQGIIRSSDIVSTGELCYLLNGNQSPITFYQVVGSGKPMPFEVEGGQVYAHGQVYCDGTSAPGTTYDNNGPDTVVNLGHEYTNGICSRDCDAHFQPAVQDIDGYWMIANAGNMEWFSNKQAAASGTYTNAKLTADIDFTGVTHRPIGSGSGDKYRGIFDGQGHRITNLTAFTRQERVGIFGATRGQSTFIRNLIIDSSCSFTGSNYVAAFVGDMQYPPSPDYTTFENCINEANIVATGTKVGAFAGGSSINDGACNIVNCINRGNVSGSNTVGAFVGQTAGTGIITASYNEGKVLAGQNGSNNLVATGNVTFDGACDLSGMEKAAQGIILTAADKANGALCYSLNGDQTAIRWTQTIGTDDEPVLGTTSQQVYAHGQVYCDNSAAPGTIYNNVGPDGIINIGHEYVNGICLHNCDAKYLEPELVDGWYLLANAGNVEWYARKIQADATYGGGDKNVKLVADIDLNGVQHTPIGWDGGHKFAGNFDGQGYRISNMTSFVRENKIGFFGEIRGTARVKNIIIDKTCSVSGTTFVAGLIGCMNVTTSGALTTLENCINEADVTSTGYGAGGLVGATEFDDIGGLVLQNCANKGNITGASRTSTLAGDMRSRSVTINNTYNSGSLLGGQEGSNNLVATGNVTCNAACDASSTASRSQGTLLAPADVASGALTYWLNGDQSAICWTQTIGSDDEPVLGTGSSQVYIHGQVYCDKSLAEGSSFSNEGPDDLVQLDHNYTNGICSRNCEAHFQPAELEGDFYQLGNAGNVEWFAAKVNAGPQNIKAKLTADIDMIDVIHTPIGTYNANNPKTPFTGTFDGQGHVIRNLNVHTTDKREAGFFSRTDNATIQNIGFEDAIIESNDRAGVLGGEVYRSNNVSNIYAYNSTVTSTNTSSDKGGLAGEAAGNTRFVNCWTTFATIGGKLANTPTNSFAGVTEEEMTSGELTYKLNTGAGSMVYYQTLPTDEHPVFSGEVVYYVGNAGYSTMYDTTTGYELSGDVQAFIAASNGSWLSLTEIDDIPVSSAVILKGTYYNRVPVSSTSSDVSSNVLKGTDADTAADGTMYVLAKVDDKVGFYKATGTIAAGKAYYQSTSGVKAFYFDGDDATGISLMEDGRSQMEDGAIYNIAGQRIQKMQKGINIINGKKVLF